MPPSTHYLGLLNTFQPGNDSEDYSISPNDLSKELEIFTNSNFMEQPANMDFNAPFYPQPPMNLDYLDNTFQSVSDVAPNSASTSSAFRHPQLGHSQAPPHSQTQEMEHSSQPLKRKFDESEIALASDSPSAKSARSLEEEDKRRRNTAASARFRVKKKQREQALQQSAKDMSDKCTALETRVKELEMENKWLRSLIKTNEPLPISSLNL